MPRVFRSHSNGIMAFTPVTCLVNGLRQNRVLIAALLLLSLLYVTSIPSSTSCDPPEGNAAPRSGQRDGNLPEPPAERHSERTLSKGSHPDEAEGVNRPTDLDKQDQGDIQNQSPEMVYAPECPMKTGKGLPKGYKITNFADHVSPAGCTLDMEACMLNQDRAKIRNRISPARNGSSRVQDLVTLTIKTRHRYLEVEEFIRSVYQFYDKLPVVVLDEFNPNMSDSSGRKWSDYVTATPTVTHVQSAPGVGYGRRLAVMLAQTPYVIIADDDYIFSGKTNLNKLLSVLERTDADIVSGATSDAFPFAGAFRVAQSGGDHALHLTLYPGIFHDRLSCFENCYVADIVKTFFMARRDVILAAGSWDPSRPFYEHEDFFFQMRKARVKVAYCDDVIVKHVARTRQLANLRQKHFDALKGRLQTKWKVADYYLCKAPETYLTSYECPEPKRKHFH